VDLFLNKILELKLLRLFRTTTTPRWFVLLIDMLIVTLSYALLVVANIYSDHALEDPVTIVVNWLVLIGVYLAVSLMTKSYAFIIRLSVIEDLIKSFVVVFFSTITLIIINLVYLIITGKEIVSFWNIIFIGTLVLSVFMIERLLIKHVYMLLTSASTKRRRVLVLGTSLSSIILANALRNEPTGKYEPIGLLSMKPDETQSNINGFDVFKFDPETLAEVFDENNVSALLFSANNIELMRKGFADYFINNNITLLAINKIEEFDSTDDDNNSNLSTRVKEIQIEDLLGRDPIVLDNVLIQTNIYNSCVMITGGCGSIGSEIVRQVVAYKASTIVIVDQAETPMHDLALEMQKSNPNADVELFIGDVANYARMDSIFRRFHPKYVFHAAAYKHVPMMELNPTEAVLTNVRGTKNIADLSLKYNVYKFVMISTDKAVNPTNVMGCTKRLAEIYTQSLFFDSKARGLKTQFITTRFGNVLGSNGSVVPLFHKQIADGGPVTITHRDIIRYFMTIPEACSLVLEAGCMGSGGEIYIFDMGEPVKIYNLACRMISLAGLRPNKDIQIKEIGLRPGEKLYEELLNDKEKTTATLNKKIMIAKVRTYNYNDVNVNVNNIIDFAAKGDIHKMIYLMKEFVPEFKSNKSRFEEIDKELEAESESLPSGNPETEKYY
jgi:FlaA1/EpsC-like NDP-sugar epimerase